MRQSYAESDLDFETLIELSKNMNQRKEMIRGVTFCGSMMLTSTVSRSS